MRAPRERTYGSPSWIAALFGVFYLPALDGMREGFADRLDGPCSVRDRAFESLP
jgi:hypothetical protein